MRKKILWEIYDGILDVILSISILIYCIISLVYPKWFFNKSMQRTNKLFNQFIKWLLSKFKFNLYE